MYGSREALGQHGLILLAVGFVLFVAIGMYSVHRKMSVTQFRQPSRPKRVPAGTRSVFPLPPPYQPDYVGRAEGLRALGRATWLFIPAIVLASYIIRVKDSQGNRVIGAGGWESGVATLAIWLTLLVFVYVAGFLQSAVRSEAEKKTFTSSGKAGREARRITRVGVATIIIFGLVAVGLTVIAEGVVIDMQP